LRDSLVFPVVLALSNTLFWAVALYPFKRQTLVSAKNPHLLTVTNQVLIGFILTNAAVFIACWLSQRVRLTSQQRQLVRRAADDAYALVPLAVAFAVAAFSNYAVTRWSTLLVVAACGLPALAHPGFRNAIARNRSRIALDIAAVVMILMLGFDTDYSHDVHHFAFYLGPAASLVGGGRPLVNINCQYGVAVVYMLAGAFKFGLVPGTYQGMSAFVSALGIVQFLVLYVMLRLCLRSQWYALLGVLAILLERVFGAYSYISYPSLGPMRFLWGHVLLFCVALRYRFPRRANIMRVFELLTLALSSIWSVEAAMGAFGAFIGVLFFETAFANKPMSRKLLQAAAVAACAALTIGLAHGLLAAEIRHQTGEWPHWSHYLAYVSMYSKIGFLWAFPIIPWEPWALVLLPYFGTLIALLARRPFFGRKDVRLEHVVVFGMAALGVVEFSHYVGRSHINHLRVYLIPLFLGAYWLDRVARRSSAVPESFRRSFLFAGYCSLGLLVLSTLEGFTVRFKNTALSRVATDHDIASPWQASVTALSLTKSTQALLQDTTRLVRQYEPNGRKVALFMEQYQRPVVLLKLKRAHVWPLALPDQDAFEPSAKERVQNFRHGLVPGSLIFVSEANLSSLDREILNKLQQEFRFSELEASASGLKVIRLEARTP